MAILVSVLGNPRRGWGVFAECFFAETVLVGLGRTLLLTTLGGAGRLHHYARGALRTLPPIACREVLVKLGILRLHAAAPAISVAANAYPATARTKRDGGRVEAHGIFKSSGDRPCCAMLPRPTLAFQAAREGKTRLVSTLSGGFPETAEIAVATKKDVGIADAITAALNAQIANGNYAKALEKWSLTAEGLTASRTNPPGLPAK